MSTPGRRSVTIELDAALHHRLCERAESEGVNLPTYCRDAIERDLNSDTEVIIGGRKPFDIDGLIAFRDELLGDRVFPGDSVDLIREAREERTKQMEEWR